MSIDKWLLDDSAEKEKKKKDELFESLPEFERRELKLKTIRKITRRNEETKSKLTSKEEEFLDDMFKFKNWLNSRTYLKGDIDKLETWISNLYHVMKSSSNQISNSTRNNNQNHVMQRYKEIPPDFLDEKSRIMLQKIIRGTQISNSDRYYLNKLKKEVQEKLNELKYYDLLKKILKL